MSRVPRTIGGRLVEDIYQKKTQLEHILIRPDSYVGSNERSESEMWTINVDCTEIYSKNMSYTPGLLKIFDEIIVNAADNKQRDPDMSTLKVDIDQNSGMISVMNDGRGIPIEIHREHGCYIPELIFGQLLTGSNFDDSEKKTTGGRNGYGAKLANIFSTEFIVETADKTVGKCYKQKFYQNMMRKDDPIISTYSGRDYTKISFVPEWSRFNMDRLDENTLSLFKKRVFDIAACMSGFGGKKVKVATKVVVSNEMYLSDLLRAVYLDGNYLQVPNFQTYLKMYNGIEDIIVNENINGWEIAIGPSDGHFRQVSFVNAICTTKGGQHVNHICKQIIDYMQKVVKKKFKKKWDIKPHYISNQLFIGVNALVENPSFDSQCKECLTTKPAAFGYNITLSDKTLKKIESSSLCKSIQDFCSLQADKELSNTSGTKTKRSPNISKLIDAPLAGTARSTECTLILTEGDSAKTFAVSGVSMIGTEKFGIFPLRGKILNVREYDSKAVSAHVEISNIVQIMGLKYGMDYSDAKKLRYGHIMIMTDQDYDGSHIKGLLINFIDHYWPSLLKVEGFLCQFITPILKVTRNSLVKSFFTISSYEEWYKTIGQQRWNIKYYKGLGTSTAAEAKEYFAALGKHRITFVWTNDEDSDLVDLAFHKSRVEDRKKWIENCDINGFINFEEKMLRYKDFINKDLIFFSLEDNRRSIPSMMDGLKPSQRKVMYTCLKCNITKDTNVVALAGTVSQLTQYHHGEKSLHQTIINLAQDYCGSNNLPLLVPEGQFGTRVGKGSDSAAPRYIHTKLQSMTRKIFHVDDDPLLNHLEDNGASIEPEFYVPVIPMVLINGSEGIGTGWSTVIPNYNPRDVIENLRRMIRGEEIVVMTPWYRGFVGYIRRIGTKAGYGFYETEGIIERTAPDIVEISELPINRGIDEYHEFLKKMHVDSDDNQTEKKKSKKSKGATDENSNSNEKEEANKEDKKRGLSAELQFCLQEIVRDSNEEKAHFKLTIKEKTLDIIENLPGGLLKFFKLTSKFSETNLTLFDQNGKIKRFKHPGHILQEFFQVRMRYYELRKGHLLKKLETDLTILTNKARFIRSVIDGSLSFLRRSRNDIISQLESENYAKIIPENKIKITVQNDENENEAENQRLVGKGYSYLFAIRIDAFTAEEELKLNKDIEVKIEELNNLRNTQIKDCWQQDLCDVIEAIDNWSQKLNEKKLEEAKNKKKLRMAMSMEEKKGQKWKNNKNKESEPKVKLDTPAAHKRQTEINLNNGTTVSLDFADSLSRNLLYVTLEDTSTLEKTTKDVQKQKSDGARAEDEAVLHPAPSNDSTSSSAENMNDAANVDVYSLSSSMNRKNENDDLSLYESFGGTLQERLKRKYLNASETIAEETEVIQKSEKINASMSKKQTSAKSRCQLNNVSPESCDETSDAIYTKNAQVTSTAARPSRKPNKKVSMPKSKSKAEPNSSGIQKKNLSKSKDQQKKSSGRAKSKTAKEKMVESSSAEEIENDFTPISPVAKRVRTTRGKPPAKYVEIISDGDESSEDAADNDSEDEYTVKDTSSESA